MLLIYRLLFDIISLPIFLLLWVVALVIRLYYDMLKTLSVSTPHAQRPMLNQLRATMYTVRGADNNIFTWYNMAAGRVRQSIVGLQGMSAMPSGVWCNTAVGRGADKAPWVGMRLHRWQPIAESCSQRDVLSTHQPICRQWAVWGDHLVAVSQALARDTRCITLLTTVTWVAVISA